MFLGQTHSKETKEKMRLSHLGRKYTMSEEGHNVLSNHAKNISKDTNVRIKISETLKKKYNSGEIKVKRCSEEGKQKIIENNKKRKGENHYNWKGGISKLPYPFEFDKELKNKILIRDKFTCQECHISARKSNYPMEIHHINYDKNDLTPENLITLCKACHTQTNFNREDWNNYFENKMIYGGR